MTFKILKIYHAKMLPNIQHWAKIQPVDACIIQCLLHQLRTLKSREVQFRLDAIVREKRLQHVVMFFNVILPQLEDAPVKILQIDAVFISDH
jgi:hypothetical protein